MDWRASLLVITLVYYVNGFSKYGRTCKDIGCLNSEVCVLAEDPCSFGSSNCGTYPTCKKKSQVEGSHAEPPKPSVTTPKPPTPVHNFDSVPNYPPPAPPNRDPYGGSSPYGNNSPYGGHSNQGGNSPYGGNPPYTPHGGNNSPYGGNSPYSGGNNSPYGHNSPYGNNSPYGSNSPTGGHSPYGGSRPTSSGGFGSGGSSPLDSILSTLNKYANSGGGGSSGSNGGSLSSIFGNVLNDLTKSGGLNKLFNTRPIMENPNYSSYSSNSRSSNPQYYPSGQSSYQQPTQNRNYGQSYAHHSAATTHKPVSYGWNVG